WRATGALSHRPYHLALLARALATAGVPAEGLIAVDEALALAASTGERFLEAELHRLRGEIFVAQARRDERGVGFRRAVEVARAQDARGLELRAATSFIRLHRRTEREAEAQAQLTATCGWFTEGFDTPDLRDARKLLEE